MKRLKKTLDTFDLPPTPPSPPQQQNGTKMSTQTYKVIGLRKKPDEPLVSVGHLFKIVLPGYVWLGQQILHPYSQYYKL